MTFNLLLNKRIRELQEKYKLEDREHKPTFVYYCNKQYQMSVVLCSHIKEVCKLIGCNLIINNIDYTSERDEFMEGVLDYNSRENVEKVIIGIPMPNSLKYCGYDIMYKQEGGELEKVLFLQLFSESHIDYMTDLKEFYSSLMLLVLA